MRRLAVVALVAVALAPLPARAAVHSVSVRSNFYDPKTIKVGYGDTIVWTAVDAGHTVTADDLRFDFYKSRTLNQGESASFTVGNADETILYNCRVHADMTGAIVVGKGSVVVPPPEPDPEVRTVPSEAFPTIEAAVEGAPPRSIVEILPGRYGESVLVVAPGITIRGKGEDAGDVVIEGGGGSRAHGFRVTAAGVSVQNLTVTGFATAGVSFETVSGFRASDVVAVDTGQFGVVATASRGGVIDGVTASGASLAGIAVRSCAECDTVVEDVSATNSAAGFLAMNAGSLVIRGSRFFGNGAGVVLKTSAARDGVPQAGAHVFGNVIEQNLGPSRRMPPVSETLDLAVGAGVWIAGGWHNVVEGNEISGHLYGVAVTGLGAPVNGARVAGNSFTGSSIADVGWDGLGVSVCFAENANGANQASSEPPLAASLYPCDGIARAGVPYPKVDADLLLHALTRA